MSRDALLRMDARLTGWFRSLPFGAVSKRALSILAHSGDSLVLVPLLVLLWGLDRFSRHSVAVPLGLAFFVSTALATALKYGFRRRRPPGEWGALYRRTDPHSFPSGHAARTASLAIVLLARGLPLAGSLLLGWSLAVGFARVVLGVHYLFDVTAGFLLGLAIGAALWVGMPHAFPG